MSTYMEHKILSLRRERERERKHTYRFKEKKKVNFPPRRTLLKYIIYITPHYFIDHITSTFHLRQKFGLE